MAESVYLFQKNMLLMPRDASEALLYEGVPFDTIDILPVRFIEIPSFSKYEPQREERNDIKIGDVPADVFLPPKWYSIPVRQAVSMIPREKSGDLLRAFHIAQWRRESVFCGVCGAENTEAEGGLVRICPRCKRVEYPRIAPAIIALIINNEGKILLAHNTNFKKGLYSLIAGFSEAGESLEQTVEREIMEETGLKVKDICYILSQPWPFPGSLMTGWTAKYAEGVIQPDGQEIEDARWFERDALPDLPGNGSIARELIDRWIVGKI